MGFREDLLKKVASAQASGGGNNIRDGIYTFEICNLLLEKKYKGEIFIVEFLVRDAKAVQELDKQGKPVVPNEPGSRCSWVLNLTKNESAPGNMKKFFLDLYGYAEHEVTPDELATVLDMALAGDQPCRGWLIGDETYRKTIQKGPNAGQPFTAHGWKTISATGDNAPERVAERRAKQESSGAAAPAA